MYLNKVKQLISEKTGVEFEEIEETSYFEEDLNVSEIELMEILTDLEDELHVELVGEKGNIETVQDLTDMLTEQIE